MLPATLLVVSLTRSVFSESGIQRGIVFSGGALSSPAAPLESTQAAESLKALASTGASHVRLVVTLYQDSPNSSTVYPLRAPSNNSGQSTPLATETDESVTETLRLADSLGLKVFLSPRVDLNWDLMPPGSRSTTDASIAQISPASVPMWFESYTNQIVKYARLCHEQAETCTIFGVADSLDGMYGSKNTAQWVKLIRAVRSSLSTSVQIVVAAAQVEAVEFWGEVDAIGVNALPVSLFQPNYERATEGVVSTALPTSWPPVPFGTVVSSGGHSYAHAVTLEQCQLACNVALDHTGPCDTVSYTPEPPRQCYLWSHPVEWNRTKAGVAGWQSYKQASAGWPSKCDTATDIAAAWTMTGQIKKVAAVAAQHSKPFIVTAFGGQSRPLAHRSPSGIVRPGHSDCSAHNRCYDPACQAALIAGFHQAWASTSGFAGSYVWRWSTDPTQGGPSDASFSPRGKKAEGVLRQLYGAQSATVPPVNPFLLLPEREHRSAAHTAVAERPGKRPLEGVRNGFVFGTGEWSSAEFALNSPESLQSIDNAVEIAGVNALEFMVTWYFSSKFDTEFYPDRNETSATRTATDSELLAAMTYAKKVKNLTVAFTPFLDPYCNGFSVCAEQSYQYILNDNVWRAEVGTGFNQSQWDAFFDQSNPNSYASFILRYAKIAEAAGCDEYFVSHEDVTAVRNAPNNHWVTLVADVRAVFSGKVSAAINWGPFLSSAPLITPPWLSDLDYIGVDCYFSGAPRNPSLKAWENPPLADLVAAWHTPRPGVGTQHPGMPWVEAFGNFSKATGGKKPNGMMDIVCTEVGYQSKPQSWVNPAGTDEPDDASCDVTSQCVNTAAQGLAYEALFTVLYPLPFFKGFYLWLWRADPTSGGMSDDQFGPQGKIEAQRAMDAFWR